MCVVAGVGVGLVREERGHAVRWDEVGAGAACQQAQAKVISISLWVRWRRTGGMCGCTRVCQGVCRGRRGAGQVPAAVLGQETV